MSISATSSSDALSYLQSLLQTAGNLAGNTAGVGPVGDWLAAAGNSGSQASGAAPGTPPAFGMAPPPFPDGTMAALIALKSQDASGANGTGSAQGLFGKLDTDGDGKISQGEFESALSSSGVDTSSADALFAKLDKNGDGSIDQGELTSATRRGHGHHHHGMAAGGAGGGDGGGADSLLNATGADGAKTQTTTNADGSSTTTITYADGSTVTMTTPAVQPSNASSGNGGATQTAANGSPVNLIEQLIKMQSQLIAKQAASVSAVA
ncbi:MAG: EF-hand domain-containing protein [Pseudolabrys sp.]